MLFGFVGLATTLQNPPQDFKIYLVWLGVSFVGFAMLTSGSGIRKIKDYGDAIGDAWRDIKRDSDDDDKKAE